MSHIVTIKTQIKDRAAVNAACSRLGIDRPTVGTFNVFSENISGLGVQLTGWSYPVVIDLATGTVKADNYGGQWGDPAKLDAFKQAYAVEKAKIEARKKGHQVTERTTSDGSIQLTITTGR